MRSSCTPWRGARAAGSCLALVVIVACPASTLPAEQLAFACRGDARDRDRDRARPTGQPVKNRRDRARPTLIDPGIPARQAEIREEQERASARGRGSESQTLKLEKAHELQGRMAFEQGVTATLESPAPSHMEISAESKARAEPFKGRGPGAEVGKVYNLVKMARLERAGWQEIHAIREPKARQVARSLAADQRRRAFVEKDKARVQELLERSGRELTPKREELLAKIDNMQQKMLRTRCRIPSYPSERLSTKDLLEHHLAKPSEQWGFTRGTHVG